MPSTYRKPDHLRGLKERLRTGPIAALRDTDERVSILERSLGGAGGEIIRTVIVGGGATGGGGGGGAGVTVGTYASRPSASAASGQFYMASDRANTLYYSDGSSWSVVNPRVTTLSWYHDGRMYADAAVGQGPMRYLPTLDGMTDESVAIWKPVRWKAHVRGAPAGASIIVQVEYGTTATPGTDLFASGDRPTITAGSNEATGTTFADSAIENGTAFELVIDQVGSTAGSEGEDLSFQIEFAQMDA